MPNMERRIIGTVVGVEAKDENASFVEIECEALEDVTAFQIVSTDLSFDHVALNRAAGSRLNLICARGSGVTVGQKVKIVVSPLESSELRRRGSENALGCAEQGADETAKPVGTFAGSRDLNVRTREGHAVPQDTGDQGGGQN
jgi:hypothetical protein